jgi:hypothetical protein
MERDTGELVFRLRESWRKRFCACDKRALPFFIPFFIPFLL